MGLSLTCSRVTRRQNREDQFGVISKNYREKNWQIVDS